MSAGAICMCNKPSWNRQLYYIWVCDFWSKVCCHLLHLCCILIMNFEFDLNMQHPGCNVWARAASAAGIPVSVPFQSLWPTKDIKNWVKSHECQYLRFISLVAAGGGDDFHRHIYSCVLSEPQCTNAILCLKELHKIDDPESFFLVISLLLIIWHSGCNLMVWWRIYQGTNMPICTGAQVHNFEYSVMTRAWDLALHVLYQLNA